MIKFDVDLKYMRFYAVFVHIINSFFAFCAALFLFELSKFISFDQYKFDLFVYFVAAWLILNLSLFFVKVEDEWIENWIIRITNNIKKTCLNIFLFILFSIFLFYYIRDSHHELFSLASEALSKNRQYLDSQETLKSLALNDFQEKSPQLSDLMQNIKYSCPGYFMYFFTFMFLGSLKSVLTFRPFVELFESCLGRFSWAKFCLTHSKNLIFLTNAIMFCALCLAAVSFRS